MTTNLGSWERRISVAGGLSLLALAASRRQMRPGLLLTAAALLGRGASGYCPITAGLRQSGLRSDDPRVALAGDRGIRLAESVTVSRSPEELFAFWRDLTHLPSFMRHLDQVEVLDSNHSRWTARGPAGMRVEWEAEIINEIRNELIGWKSLPGADVVSAGSVHFRPRPGGRTRVDVVLQYEPPVGMLGDSLAWLTGYSPRTMLREDLARLKAMFEGGATSPETAQFNAASTPAGSESLA